MLTSSAANEDSYRISSDGTQTEDSMATVFGRSLAEGAGWDLVKDKSVVMKADLQRDRVITLHEIYVYTKKRTNWRLSTSSVRQNVQVYPMGDPSCCSANDRFYGLQGNLHCLTRDLVSK